MDLAANGHIANVQVSKSPALSCGVLTTAAVCRSLVSDDSRVLPGIFTGEIKEANAAVLHESEEVSSLSIPDSIS